ncbi:MAG: tRNA (N6-threonylcarbamoyladenosine(37)-N6)-methyltransferase TrmO [Lentisphaeria bacterium]
MEIEAIGTFYCLEKYPYDVPRQGSLSADNWGKIELLPGMNFEQSVFQLDEFSHLWLIFGFHHNTHWKPMVRPPRHRLQKVGVFASRAPYRPNFLGLSCVELVKINGLDIYVRNHDLLDKTPIYDIKPYLAYADSFPDANPGWTATDEEELYTLGFEPEVLSELQWLEDHGVSGLRTFIGVHLENDPLNRKRHRLQWSEKYLDWILAYRTWRVVFGVNEESKSVLLKKLFSGYTEDELKRTEDLYKDKEVHRKFNSIFGKDELL